MAETMLWTVPTMKVIYLSHDEFNHNQQYVLAGFPEMRNDTSSGCITTDREDKGKS